ncbi:MAG: SusC/RagA family TonB-linked outer membrane protein [Prevotellaceae bacterium]|jgi:TonB-linked SusC/RagA family outer membrane protein|nr:SusC/RagA family TonB-linked outer membrane protein [Prevotellaceae bacterium]
MKTKSLLFFLLFLLSMGVAAQQEVSEKAVDLNVKSSFTVAGVATFTVTGVALSAETRQPIAGVSLIIPGVATAITDDAGRFALENAEIGDVIQVRMAGFAYKEALALNDRELTVLLHDESFKTIYRQVGTPFGSRDWVASTASVATIAGKGSYKKAVAGAESLIQDEGLGVNTLMRSGVQGAGGNMYLRGFNSLNANSQPMIVVDGIPYENSPMAPSLISGNSITPLTGIDIKDIDAITVLKDATSIYGSKGANGVILIETARAQEQATKIDFYAYGGINLAPSNRYPMMSSQEYRPYLIEMLSTSGAYTPAQIQALPYINAEKPAIRSWGVEGNADYYRYRQETDWQKEIFANSVSQNYYVSIKGGDDVALYALSVGYLNHENAIKNTDFARYNTQFNSQVSVLKYLKMETNMSVSYSDRSLPYEGLSENFNPMYVSLIKAPFMSPYLYNEQNVQTPNYEQADVFGVSNPTALVDGKTSITSKSYRFFGNIGFNLDLGQYFALNATFGVTFDKTRERIFLPENGLSHEPLSSGVVHNEMKGLVARYLQYYTDVRLKYRQDFTREHRVTANLGVRYQTNSAENDWINAYNSSSDDMQTLGNGSIDLASVSGLLNSWKWASLYLNGEYAYKRRYLLSLNVAMDGSSRFGKEGKGGVAMLDNVFGVFPSVGAAWLISSEEAIALPAWVNLLKLRASYSLAGNDDIGYYAARASYASQNLLGYYGLVRENIANLALQWETTTKLNAGLDVALLNERLCLTLDVYQSKTANLLTWVQGKDYYGISEYVVNDGALSNKGVELGMRGRIVNAALKWDMGLNVARYANELTELDGNEKITTVGNANILTKVGNPIGLFYGYKTGGVYATSSEAAAEGLNIRRGDGTLAPFGAGDVRFLNLNSSDNVINEEDMAVIGDPNPDFFGSIVNRLQWKRLTLNAVITFSYGNDIYNALRASVESMTGAENQTTAIINRWSKEGHQTDIPRAAWGDPMGNARFSDRWIEDGSYIRLKSVSLSYDIPLSVSYIKGLQVYVTGANLLTFTKYLGYDPEFSTMQSPLYYGVDMGVTPQPRSIMVGVKLGL